MRWRNDNGASQSVDAFTPGKTKNVRSCGREMFRRSWRETGTIVSLKSIERAWTFEPKLPFSAVHWHSRLR